MAQNQMQQQNYAPQQNALAQEQAAANENTNKPNAPATLEPGTRPGSVSESVEVQPLQQASVASVPPAPAPQLTRIPVAGKNFDLARDQGAKLKQSEVRLPSGLGTLSVATSAQRMIALDTAGALFLSEDDGKHWQPVKTQWTGRALLLRVRQVGAVSGALPVQQLPHFELVNDKLQTWVSNDGNTWKEQILPGK
jgi:hypothetical protein